MNLKHAFIILFSGFVLSGCDLESSLQYDVLPNISGWNLPDTTKISTPFNIYIVSTTDNSCTHNLRFYVEQSKDFEFIVWAKSTYINHGEDCTIIETAVDTTISLTLNDVGKYYFLFKYNNTPKKDSIVVIP